MIEIGFIKGTDYDSDKSLFPSVEHFKNVLESKKTEVTYVGMIDMSAPVDKDCITPYDGSSIAAIKVIFKKNKIKDAYDYCSYA